MITLDATSVGKFYKARGGWKSKCVRWDSGTSKAWLSHDSDPGTLKFHSADGTSDDLNRAQDILSEFAEPLVISFKATWAVDTNARTATPTLTGKNADMKFFSLFNGKETEVTVVEIV